MSLRISTNVASIAAQRYLTRTSDKIGHAIQAIASGSRLVRAGDDPAGFAISESLRGQAKSLEQAKRNADVATGFIQVAEGGLNEQNNILIRLRELAVQSASDTIGDDEREFLNGEFDQMVKEFDRIAETTRFGNKQLLTGTNEEFEFHLGTGSTDNDIIRYKFDTDTRADAIGISGLSVSDQDSAKDVLETVDESLMQIAKARASFGAIQGRLQSSSDNLDVQRENILAARGAIADADIAHEVSELTRNQILHDLNVSVLAQANQNGAAALKLLS